MKLGDWISLICFGISLVILWQFRQILLLVFTAIVLAIALNSLVRRLQSFGIQRGRSVALAILMVVVGGILFISLVLPPFLDQFQQLIQLVPVGLERSIFWFEQFRASPPAWFPKTLELPDLSELVNELAKQSQPLTSQVVENFFAFFSNSLATLLQTILVIVLTIMLLVNPLAYRKTTIRLFPSVYRRRADEILAKCELSLLNWMGGVVINSLFVATLSAASLWFLKIRFVLAHALLAGIFNLVPNLGPALSVVFPVSVALLNAPWKALAVLIVYVVIQNLESYVFSPMVMQKQISLLPAATLIAQLFFATFFGFLGLVLALPLAVVTKVWMEEAIIKDILDKGDPMLGMGDQQVVDSTIVPLLPIPSQDEEIRQEARLEKDIPPTPEVVSDMPVSPADGKADEQLQDRSQGTSPA